MTMNNVDLRESILKELEKNVKHCPLCFGVGKLKAMQSVATFNSTSIRDRDTEITCNHCSGTGLIY